MEKEAFKKWCHKCNENTVHYYHGRSERFDKGHYCTCKGKECSKCGNVTEQQGSCCR